MAAPKCSDEEFIRLFEQHGAAEAAKILGCATANVFARRRRIEGRHGRQIVSPATAQRIANDKYPYRLGLEIDSGVVFTGSDWHIWPGFNSTAYRAWIKLSQEIKPDVVILNGDVLDGAIISRHPPLGWSELPKVREEFAAAEEILSEVEQASKSAEKYWLIGNHDSRFETRLAAQAGEFEGVSGFRLCDHFPAWRFGWSLWINDDVVVKHRFKGGIHATHNNTLWAGRTMITGHLHSLKVTPFDDYNGTRFGVDLGTMNDPHGPHTEYVEDNPLNHRQGFGVLTFHKGRLLWPELVAVVDENHVQFRGKLIEV